MVGHKNNVKNYILFYNNVQNYILSFNVTILIAQSLKIHDIHIRLVKKKQKEDIDIHVEGQREIRNVMMWNFLNWSFGDLTQFSFESQSQKLNITTSAILIPFVV